MFNVLLLTAAITIGGLLTFTTTGTELAKAGTKKVVAGACYVLGKDPIDVEVACRQADICRLREKTNTTECELKAEADKLAATAATLAADKASAAAPSPDAEKLAAAVDDAIRAGRDVVNLGGILIPLNVAAACLLRGQKAIDHERARIAAVEEGGARLMKKTRQGLADCATMRLELADLERNLRVDAALLRLDAAEKRIDGLRAEAGAVTERRAELTAAATEDEQVQAALWLAHRREALLPSGSK